MKKQIKSVCVALLMCTGALVSNAQTTNVEHYASKPFDCAIFPASYPTDMEGTHFTPTHDDVDKAAKPLTNGLKDVKCNNKDDLREILKNLDKYKIQVFGYVAADGTKLLFLNCFRNDKNKDKDLANSWLIDMVQVEDGGDYFWTIKFDIGKNQLIGFTENGNG